MHLYRLIVLVVIVYGLVVLLVALVQRSLIYFPTHDLQLTALSPWQVGEQKMGYCREVPSPRAAWLMLHGNAGQASHRDYVLRCLAATDSLYVLEYPGYGSRPGKPTQASLDAAASEAYEALRARYPTLPVCVLGESIGSGPASVLAQKPNPPDKIVLVVPFDRLASLATELVPIIPAGWILRDRWDNRAALHGYRGKLEIFGAIDDRVIPYHHAKNLASALPSATFHTVNAGHNDWWNVGTVRIGW